MIRIRMARAGAKKRPYYHIVVANARAPRDGRCIENIGFFNPMVNADHPQRLHIESERLQHWLSQGAQPSVRVSRFLSPLGLLPKLMVPKQTKKNLPKAKAQERAAKRIEAAKKLAEAAQETSTDATTKDA